MDFLTALHISRSGLTTQRTMMNVIASNLANINATRTPDGGPYKRRVAVVEATPMDDFQSVLDEYRSELSGVRVGDIVEENSPFRNVYDPNHPDANTQGYVSYPNVNLVTETANLMIARRSYEANVAAVSATKRMAMKALEIGK